MHSITAVANRTHTHTYIQKPPNLPQSAPLCFEKAEWAQYQISVSEARKISENSENAILQ